MWHPHFRRNKLSENEIEVVDSIGKDLVMLWKIFSDKNEETRIKIKTSIDNIETNTEVRKMRCECRFVKRVNKGLKILSTNEDFQYKTSSENNFLPPDKNNRLKSFFMNNNRKIPSESTENYFNNNPLNLLNLNTNLMKNKQNLEMNKFTQYNLQSSPNSNIAETFRMKELQNSNFEDVNQNKNINDVLSSLKYFSQLQSQSNKRNDIRRTNPNFSDRSFLPDSEFPNLKIPQESDENLSTRNIMNYLQSNFMIMKNLENLLKNQNSFTNNREVNFSNIDSNRLVMNKQNFEENFKKKEQHEPESKFFDLKPKDSNRYQPSPSYNNLSNEDLFHGNPSNDLTFEDKNIHSKTSEANLPTDESQDLLKIVKNLNLNTNSNFSPSSADNEGFLQLDLSKYRELLK